MTTPEPRAPLTAAEIAEIRTRLTNFWERTYTESRGYVDAVSLLDTDAPRLLDELERCRALLTVLTEDTDCQWEQVRAYLRAVSGDG